MRKTKQQQAIFVVVDPLADFGKTRHRWPFFKEEMQRQIGECQSAFVSKDQPVVYWVKAAIDSQAKILVIFGDDATLNLAVNEIMKVEKGKRPCLAVFSSSAYAQGFFNSLVPQSLKMNQTERMEYAVKMIADGESEWIDLGLAKFNDRNGNAQERYFINLASYGVSPQIVEALPDADNSLHSGLAFIAASVKSLLNYHPPAISVKADRRTIFQKKRIFNFFVANGANGPAGMCIAPEAKLNDGKLDALLVPDAPVSELMMELPKFWFANGDLQGALRVSAPEISATVNGLLGLRDSLRLELDGILVGYLPASFHAQAKALQVIR